eukprot:CAMPEP_0177232550 /NCGR_PEP_ID=MMETSP0367-20130122/43380_1 /TAXON_ID=447022 ORGANISM="Scrippsiella hangoei-like, Strain SHHI-4" /NCGR_SAMPLE_ID=MMETSP0367 /ASSEMBLY_ACC=CAM_ASM_000362 /LENGTH=112 /DNA_ID=CAMNT_0018683199 /DNA_START=271 /DNA_END=607 /DNA_ORIENTATION=+
MPQTASDPRLARTGSPMTQRPPATTRFHPFPGLPAIHAWQGVQQNAAENVQLRKLYFTLLTWAANSFNFSNKNGTLTAKSLRTFRTEACEQFGKATPRGKKLNYKIMRSASA